MKNKKISIITILLIVFGSCSVFLFQNCGNSGGHAGIVSDTKNSEEDTEDENTDVSPSGYRAGTPFNYALVKQRSQMVQTQLNSREYLTNPQEGTLVKAVAINQNGLGFAGQMPNGTDAEIQRKVLQACYIIGGRLPCALLAAGDYFAVNENELSESFQFILTKQTTFNRDIPFLSNKQIDTVYKAYTEAKSPKALAISIGGGTYSLVHSNDVALKDTEEARRIARERCEMSAIYSPCILYAADDDVVFNPNTFKFIPRVNYTATSVGTTIPGITEADYNATITSYLVDAAVTNKFGAVYISSDGIIKKSVRNNQEAADLAAQTSCSNCFKYMNGLQVLSPGPNLLGLQSQKDIFCKSNPRPSCTDHKNMGCVEAGNYYIAKDDGSISLEACP